MQFWIDGKKCDTATMTAKEKIVLLTKTQETYDELMSCIAEFNVCQDLREFSTKHFGRDGAKELYDNRKHVADFLEWRLNDFLASDRVKALKIMGCELLG